MKPTTLDWIRKAEDDWRVAQRVYRARKEPSYDAACYHSQQCAEKYLKSILYEAGQAIPKIHNLIDLLNQCELIDPGLGILLADVSVLNAFPIDYRYPGKDATKSQAQDALKRCRNVRKIIRQSFGLPV